MPGNRAQARRSRMASVTVGGLHHGLMTQEIPTSMEVRRAVAPRGS
jgi:hypothetical protein